MSSTYPDSAITRELQALTEQNEKSLSTTVRVIGIINTAISALRFVARAHHEEHHNPHVPLRECPDKLCRVATVKLGELDQQITSVADSSMPGILPAGGANSQTKSGNSHTSSGPAVNRVDSHPQVPTDSLHTVTQGVGVDSVSGGRP